MHSDPRPNDTTRILDLLGVPTVVIDRTNGANPFATMTRYGDCPDCGTFATVFVTERGTWSLCGHFGSPKRPLDRFDLMDRLVRRTAA